MACDFCRYTELKRRAATMGAMLDSHSTPRGVEVEMVFSETDRKLEDVLTDIPIKCECE
jgi:hypothetical protein